MHVSSLDMSQKSRLKVPLSSRHFTSHALLPLPLQHVTLPPSQVSARAPSPSRCPALILEQRLSFSQHCYWFTTSFPTVAPGALQGRQESFSVPLLAAALALHSEMFGKSALTDFRICFKISAVVVEAVSGGICLQLGSCPILLQKLSWSDHGEYQKEVLYCLFWVNNVKQFAMNSQ